MLRACWLSLHALLVAAIVLVALPVVAKIMAMTVVGAHAWLHRPRPPGAAHLRLEADDIVRIVTANGNVALPDAGSRITAYWVLLRWREPRGRGEWLVLADQLDAGDWARLSARLRRGPGIGRSI